MVSELSFTKHSVIIITILLLVINYMIIYRLYIYIKKNNVVQIQITIGLQQILEV